MIDLDFTDQSRISKKNLVSRKVVLWGFESFLGMWGKIFLARGVDSEGKR